MLGFSLLGALLPVMLMVGAGWCVARMGWVQQSSVKDISNLVFFVLLPALLFRTMANVTVSELDFYPVGIYFMAVALVFGGTIAVNGLRTVSAARGLAHVFSNVVMVGVPMVGLLFGDSGLVPLFTLITVHALVLLSGATVIFELASARERTRADASASPSLLKTLAQAVRNSIVHPVPVPILAGVLVAHLGLSIPGVIDKPLQMMGAAMGPMALLLVGMTLGYARIGHLWRQSLRMALVKTLVHPVVFFVCALVLGARGEAIVVLMLAAALPIGANVLLFTHRYGIGQDEVIAGMAISTVIALFCIPLVMMVLGPFLTS